MPPLLAAILFVGFIVWLFRGERSQIISVSSGLWVPFVWVAINASRPVGYWFAAGGRVIEAGGLEDGSFIDRSAYLVLIIAGMLVLARRNVNWSRLLVNGRWLLVFYLYLLASTLWSDYPYISFKRWFKDAGDLVMIAIVFTEKNPVDSLRWLFVRCAYLLVPLSVLFIKWYPAIGRYTNRWSYTQGFGGVTNNKNSLGLLAMVSGLFVLWQIVDVYRVRRLRGAAQKCWPDFVVLIMCVWILSIAGSATSLFCFLLGFFVFFGARLRGVRANLGRAVWCLAGVALTMLIFTVSSGVRGTVAELLGRNATLTERTIIWENSLKLQTNPLIGSGFSSAWLSREAEDFVEEFHLAHAHNGYLEVYLHSGLVGVFLLLGVIVSASKNAAFHLLSFGPCGYLFASLFLAGLFYNYTEVTFNRSNMMGFLLWTLSSFPRTRRFETGGVEGLSNVEVPDLATVAPGRPERLSNL